MAAATDSGVLGAGWATTDGVGAAGTVTLLIALGGIGVLWLTATAAE